MITKPKGTQDIYKTSWLYQFIENEFFFVASNFGYTEIKTPTFENLELFQSFIGNETDIVQKELYEFQDIKERKLALRPEGTASIVRAYVENKLYLESSFQKFFYSGSMFRYERPQKGRRREFRQLGIEQIGVVNEFTIVESIILAQTFLSNINIIDYKIVINNLGLKKDRDKYKIKLKKHFETKLNKLCLDCQKRFQNNPLRLLDCKIDKITDEVPTISEFISQESKNEYEAVKVLLKKANIKFIENPNLIRGLDYYSNTIYEFIPNNENGSQSTILAGGQYFDLVKKMGGPNIKGIGFAAGVERLINIIESKIIKPKIPNSIFVVGESKISDKVFEITNTLRRAGFFAEFDSTFPDVKKQFKKASKLNLQWAIICRDDKLLLKSQINQEQFEGNIKQIINYIEEKK